MALGQLGRAQKIRIQWKHSHGEWNMKVLSVFTRFLLKNLCEPTFPTDRSILSINRMQMKVRARYNGLDNNRLN